MSVLARKLRRDLSRSVGPLVAVVAMMTAGVALFVSLRSMHGYLRDALTDYYGRYRFGDLFVTVTRAPLPVAQAIGAVPGVRQVDARVVSQVLLDVPGSNTVVSGRLVSIPDKPGSMLNALHLVRGSYPVADGAEVPVAISPTFATANRLDLGDTLAALISGRRQRLRVAAIAQSPEYVYEIPGGVDVLPDGRRFGVLWIPRRILAPAFDLVGAFNDAVIALEADADTAAVIEAVDRLTAPYGGLGAFAREDQLSHQFVASEIEETQVTSILLPTIFLGVTAFMLYLVTSRMIATEREQIAVLKAFGYSNGRVMAHYARFVSAPIAVGTVLGLLLGLWFADQLAQIYARFYQFPSSAFSPDPAVLIGTVAVAAIAALAGGASAVWGAVRLAPAAAMLPPVPPRFKAGPLEWIGLTGRVATPIRIMLRGLERHPIKAALTVLGIAFGYSIVVAGWYGFDAIDLIETTAFYEADRADLTVGFREAVPARAAAELARLPGVERVELTRVVPARIRLGPRHELTAVTGFERAPLLRRPVEPPARPITVPEDGALISLALATKLRARPGQSLMIEPLVGARRPFQVYVAGTVNEVMGLGLYLDRSTLHRLMGESPRADAASLAVRPESRSEVAARLRELPRVAGVGSRLATIEAFDRTIAESFRISLLVIFGFACLIAVAVVYSSGRIALSERARELASLRVLGFTADEVARMLLGEQTLLTLMALPVGALIGSALCYAMTVRFSSVLFRLPMVWVPATYLMAAAIVVAAAGITMLVIRGRVHRLDLVAVLKARE
ncbi:MAG: FtsX-like permease family protein [Gemmatimonadales bacterium]